MARALTLPLAVIFVLLAGAFSGCFGEDAPPAPSDPLLISEDDSEPAENVTATRPDDLTGGGAPHIHDYWVGANRIVLFDGPVSAEIFGEPTFYNVLARKAAGVGGTNWEIPEGKTVFEGTGAIELTASWTDPLITGLAFGYKTPDEPETLDSYKEMHDLPNGETFEIEVRPEMTDMPHEAVSRWEFKFVAAGTPGVAQGTFNLKVEIVRMRNIDVFPGHPETFVDVDHYVLADKAFRYENPSFASFVLEYAADKRREVLVPEKGVPMGTRFLVIDLTIDVQSAAGALMTTRGLELYYRGADGVRYVTEPLEVHDNHYVFAIPVTDAQADSPYVDYSAWRFGPAAQQAITIPGTQSGLSCFMCVDVEVSGHALITAYAEDPTDGRIKEPTRR